MFNSETLEVGIGMAFIFLFASLICTAIQEWLEGLFKWRAMDLERALRALLADADGQILSHLLRHPMLDSLFPGHYDPAQLRSSWFTPGKRSKHLRLSQRRNLPSYIPSAQFAVAFLDTVARGPMPANAEGARVSSESDDVVHHTQALSVDSLRQSALALPPQLRRAILTAIDHSAGDLEQAKLNIEQWFNGTMDRASGWYKRRTQAMLFLIGLAVAALMNIDAIYIMQRLTIDKTFREVIVKDAESAKLPNAVGSGAPSDSLLNARQRLQKIGMPIGWQNCSQCGAMPVLARFGSAPLVPVQLCGQGDGNTCDRSDWLGLNWIHVLAGWLVTAFAVMLGAPFWFDILNKFMVIRSTVKPHEKSEEEASEDRQTKDKKPPQRRP